jgi:peptidoglycan/LPS O-acetylase OafA/YrhL
MKRMNPPSSNQSSRRYDLDWLRVLAVLLLVPFHSALIFTLDPHAVVYVKDHTNSPGLLLLAGFINIWHMPLLFVIAGASTWFALGQRTAGQYLRERVSRLFLPALFGLVVLIPPMTYVHYIGRASGPTFWQHYLGFFHVNPNDLTGVSGAFTPAHLWFILFLFIFSLIGLPLFLWLKKSSAAGIRGAPVGFFSRRGMLLLPFWLLALAAAIPLLDDKNPIHYFLLFCLGGLLFCNERLQQILDRDWPLYALLAALGITAYVGMRGTLYSPWSAGWILFNLIFHFSRWASVTALLGAGHRWLNADSPALRYASEAAFPFYILHLPVDTLIGFWVIRLSLPVGLKYSLIVLLTILATLAIYETFVRRIPIMRFFFGVKARQPVLKKEAARTAVPSTLAGG